MIEVGRHEVIEAERKQEWIARIASLIVHSDKYGWTTRLSGWTGPVHRTFSTRDYGTKDAAKDAAIAYVHDWVNASPDLRCAFIMS